MLGRKAQRGRDRPIPDVAGIRRQAEEATAGLQHPVDAGQHCPLVEHVFKGADADRQIDRLIRNSSQRLGITHLERKPGFRGRIPKTRTRQFDHAGRDIDPDAARHVRCKGEEVLAVAATDIQDQIG